MIFEHALMTGYSREEQRGRIPHITRMNKVAKESVRPSKLTSINLLNCQKAHQMNEKGLGFESFIFILSTTQNFWKIFTGNIF